MMVVGELVFTLLQLLFGVDSHPLSTRLSKHACRVWGGMLSLWTSADMARLKWNIRFPKWIDVKLGRP